MQCTEVPFASFLSGGFTTMAAINSPERKLAKSTSVQWRLDARNFNHLISFVVCF
jgi:hypothetical protein